MSSRNKVTLFFGGAIVVDLLTNLVASSTKPRDKAVDGRITPIKKLTRAKGVSLQTDID